MIYFKCVRVGSLNTKAKAIAKVTSPDCRDVAFAFAFAQYELTQSSIHGTITVFLTSKICAKHVAGLVLQY